MLTYYAFPDIHWQKIRTNNPLERIMREIRRRTRSMPQPGGRTTPLHRRHSMGRGEHECPCQSQPAN